jgi:hypothetical protein
MAKAATLYDDDFYAWTEAQAAELRKLAARPELSNVMDWDNLIEEVETLGRHEWRSVKSWIENSLVHILKGYIATTSPSCRHWEKETKAFLNSLRETFRNSMRQHVDMAALWKAASEAVIDEFKTFGGTYLLTIAPRCPFELDQLLDQRFTFDSAVRFLLTTNGGNAPFEFPDNTIQ